MDHHSTTSTIRTAASRVALALVAATSSAAAVAAEEPLYCYVMAQVEVTSRPGGIIVDQAMLEPIRIAVPRSASNVSQDPTGKDTRYEMAKETADSLRTLMTSFASVRLDGRMYMDRPPYLSCFALKSTADFHYSLSHIPLSGNWSQGYVEYKAPSATQPAKSEAKSASPVTKASPPETILKPGAVSQTELDMAAFLMKKRHDDSPDSPEARAAGAFYRGLLIKSAAHKGALRPVITKDDVSMANWERLKQQQELPNSKAAKAADVAYQTLVKLKNAQDGGPETSPRTLGPVLTRVDAYTPSPKEIAEAKRANEADRKRDADALAALKAKEAAGRAKAAEKEAASKAYCMKPEIRVKGYCGCTRYYPEHMSGCTK